MKLHIWNLSVCITLFLAFGVDQAGAYEVFGMQKAHNVFTHVNASIGYEGAFTDVRAIETADGLVGDNFGLNDPDSGIYEKFEAIEHRYNRILAGQVTGTFRYGKFLHTIAPGNSAGFILSLDDEDLPIGILILESVGEGNCSFNDMIVDPFDRNKLFLTGSVGMPSSLRITTWINGESFTEFVLHEESGIDNVLLMHLDKNTFQQDLKVIGPDPEHGRGSMVGNGIGVHLDGPHRGSLSIAGWIEGAFDESRVAGVSEGFPQSQGFPEHTQGSQQGMLLHFLLKEDGDTSLNGFGMTMPMWDITAGGTVQWGLATASFLSVRQTQVRGQKKTAAVGYVRGKPYSGLFRVASYGSGNSYHQSELTPTYDDGDQDALLVNFISNELVPEPHVVGGPGKDVFYDIELQPVYGFMRQFIGDPDFYLCGTLNDPQGGSVACLGPARKNFNEQDLIRYGTPGYEDVAYGMDITPLSPGTLYAEVVWDVGGLMHSYANVHVAGSSTHAESGEENRATLQSFTIDPFTQQISMKFADQYGQGIAGKGYQALKVVSANKYNDRFTVGPKKFGKSLFFSQGEVIHAAGVTSYGTEFYNPYTLEPHFLAPHLVELEDSWPEFFDFPKVNGPYMGTFAKGLMDVFNLRVESFEVDNVEKGTHTPNTDAWLELIAP